MSNIFATEGDFIETYENLIFDVKGVLHPIDKIIAFIRYIPLFLFIEKMENFLKYMISSVSSNSQYIIWQNQFIDFNNKIENWLEKRAFNEIINNLNSIFGFVINDVRIRDNNIPYLKLYDIRTRYDILSMLFPHYIFNHPNYDFPLQAVLINDIKLIHKPEEVLSNIDNKIESHNVFKDFNDTLKNITTILLEGGKISKDNIGITGSVMVNLENKEDNNKSDLDLIIYGEEEGKRIYEFLKNLLNRNITYPLIHQGVKFNIYDEELLKKHYEVRTKGFKVSFEKFYQYEYRKILQFFVNDYEVFIRLIKHRRNENPIYGNFNNIKFITMGRISLKCKITNIVDSIFTPAFYFINLLGLYNITLESSLSEEDLISIENDIFKIGAKLKIFTLRGRFTEQAKIDEVFFVSGKLELVKIQNKGNGKDIKKYFQIVLGADKDDQFYLI